MCTECQTVGQISDDVRPARARLSDAAVQREKSAIESVVNDLALAIDDAHLTLSTLTNKLDPALSLLEEKLEGPTSAPSRGSSALCSQLESLLSQVYLLQRRTNLITERVEL